MKTLTILLQSTTLHAGQWTPAEDSKIPNQNKAAPENYCKDPVSWKEWADLVAKYPNDSDVQTLHALRIGLCAKIEQGSITLDEAIRLFDRAQRMVVEKKTF